MLKQTPPSKDEILISVGELFDSVYNRYPEKLLSALIPVDKTMYPGLLLINEVVNEEMREICHFVNEFNDYLKNTQEHDQQIRLKILIYCRIMEADLPMTIFLDMFHLLIEEPCNWTFRNSSNTVCPYPTGKINELKRFSRVLNLKIGEVLDRLWIGELRNAFSHSQYILGPDFLLPSGSLSPLSRRDEQDKKNFSAIIFEEIDKLYDGANVLLKNFVTAFDYAIKPYMDGKEHSIEAGYVKWERGRWIWSQNAESK